MEFNESVLKGGVDVEGTTLVERKLFPIVRNSNVHHQFKRNCYLIRVSLNRSKISQIMFGILAVLEPRLATSLSQSVSEKSRDPLSANALSNFRPCRVQRTGASSCRPFLEIAVERDPPLSDE